MTDHEGVHDRLDRLEALVERQRETIEAQRERIAALEAGGGGSDPADRRAGGLSRRRALTAGGLFALLGVGAGTAGADPSGQVGTNSDPLTALYTAELDGPVTGGQSVTDLTGSGLTATGGALAAAATETDVTATFSGPSVTHDGTTASGGSIRLVGATTATREADDGTLSAKPYGSGIVISPNRDLPSITATVSGNTTGSDTVRLTDSNGATLASEPFPGAGGSVTLEYDLSAGTDYWVIADPGGDTHDIGYYGSPSFPYGSGGVDIVENIGNADNGSPGEFNANAIREVTAPTATAGTATVEWSRPASVSRWETAAFGASADGETVEVYVEVDDGTGWTTWDPDGGGTAEPVGAGTDLSSIPASDDVRFRVELAREDIANDPQVSAVSRQWRP